jgi:hypothetical protein
MKNKDKELEKTIEEWSGKSKHNWGFIMLFILTIVGCILLLTHK